MNCVQPGMRNYHHQTIRYYLPDVNLYRYSFPDNISAKSSLFDYEAWLWGLFFFLLWSTKLGRQSDLYIGTSDRNADKVMQRTRKELYQLPDLYKYAEPALRMIVIIGFHLPTFDIYNTLYESYIKKKSVCKLEVFSKNILLLSHHIDFFSSSPPCHPG